MTTTAKEKGGAYRAPGQVASSKTLKLEVRQTRSGAGRVHPQQRVLKGLGLSGPGSIVVVENTPSFRGMIKKVLHLVEVREKVS